MSTTKTTRKISLLLALALLLGCLAGCAEKHEHTWKDATCTEPRTCPECGETEGEPLGHKFADATCEKPKTCSVCGYTEGAALGHTLSDATCTEAATCSVCGKTEGEPLGHTLSAPTHLARSVCSVCGAEVGDLLPYAEEFGFEFTSERDFSVPIYLYLMDTKYVRMTPETQEKMGYSVAPVNANYHITGATVCDADEEGMVKIVVTYTQDFQFTIRYDKTKKGGSYSIGWQFSGINPWDYYSGNTIVIESGDAEVARERTTELPYDGKITAVSYIKEGDMTTCDFTDWTDTGDGFMESGCTVNYEFTSTFVVPRDYDGLSLYLAKAGIQEYRDYDEENADLNSNPLLEDGDGTSPDKFFVVRVKDLLG